MILVIAYADVDCSQANRLLKWIGWLSAQNEYSMLQESILLVASRRASKHRVHLENCWLASEIFGEARCYVPEGEHEKGWPGAANFMFAQALLHVEQFLEDDIFFLEPDGIPLTPGWWDRVKIEWELAREEGKSFMGALVPHDVPHMTGIAVYGSNWRGLAESLVLCPGNSAWDVWSASQVLPNAHLTPLIQHVFRRRETGWRVPGLNILDQRAVLFHQDKQGLLCGMLDEAYYNGQCAEHPIYSYLERTNPNQMTKFYTTANATKAVKSHGRSFAFDPLPVFGGSIPGVLALEKEADQIAMSDIAENPTSGVNEISQEEWEEITKKKWGAPNSSTSETSRSRLPQLPIKATPSKSPALLVEEPMAPTGETPIPGQAPIKDINDVLKIDTVIPAQNQALNASKRPRKPQQPKP